MRSEKYVGICSNVVIMTHCWSPIPMQQCKWWKLQEWKVRTEVLRLKLYWSFFIQSFLALHTPILWQPLPTNNNPGMFLDCTCSLHPVLLSHPKWWIASRLLFGLGAPCLHCDSRTMETRFPQFSLWALQLLDYKNNFVLHWWSNNQGMRICLGAAAASEAGEKKLNLQGVCFCRICSNVNMSNCNNFCKKFLFRPEGLDTWPVCNHDCEYEGLSKGSLIGGGKREQLKKRKNKETVMLWKERTQAGAADFMVAQQTWQEEWNGSRIIRAVLQE